MFSPTIPNARLALKITIKERMAPINIISTQKSTCFLIVTGSAKLIIIAKSVLIMKIPKAGPNNPLIS